MPFTLLATQVPQIPTFTGVYALAGGPLTSGSFSTGALLAANDLNLGAARRDIDARYGGGYYGVPAGLAISAGSGLTLNIAAGHAMIDGVVEMPASSLSLTDGGRSHIWVARAGAPLAVFASLVPPVGAYVYLGSALTAGGVISSVDQSGVIYGYGGIPWRRTADPDLPADTPPASYQFVHHSVNSTWFWDSLRYVAWLPSLPLPVASGGTGATTAPVALDNLGAYPQGRLIKPVSASFNFTAAEVNAASEIDMTAGGVGARFTATFPSTAHSAGDPTSGILQGHLFTLLNNTGQTCVFKANGGSDRFLGTSHWALCQWDGTEIEEVSRGGQGAGWYRYGAPSVTNPSVSYSFWDQVTGDHLEYSLSGGDVVVTYPATLSQRGYRQTIKNDSSSILDINGTKFLGQEFISLVMDGAGAMQRQVSRPYTKVQAVTHDDTANYTVPAAQAIAVILEVGGTLTAARNLVLPTATDKAWFILNNTVGGFAFTAKTSGGAGILIANGKIAGVYGNGSVIKRLTADA